jgi:hypothetical protein
MILVDRKLCKVDVDWGVFITERCKLSIPEKVQTIVIKGAMESPKVT